MAKISRPILYLGLAAVGVAAWLLTEPEQAAKPTTKRTTTSASKATAKGSQFTEADYRDPFPPLVTVSVQNAFKPLVARRTGADSLAGPGGIPAAWANGDPNWICTGTAEVDGVRMALIENKATSEGVFLRQGDRFRAAVVSEVLEDGVVMVGPGGESRTIRAKSEFEEEMAEEMPPVPVDAALLGQIGNGGLNVRPQGGNGQPQAVQAEEAPAAPPAQMVIEEDEG